LDLFNEIPEATEKYDLSQYDNPVKHQRQRRRYWSDNNELVISIQYDSDCDPKSVRIHFKKWLPDIQKKNRWIRNTVCRMLRTV
jgi:hypothetical protein